MNLSFGQKSELSSHQISIHGSCGLPGRPRTSTPSSYEGDHSFKSNGEIAVFPLGMAIQDLAIFTTLGVFVVLPSFMLFPLLMYCYGCIYGCIVRMYCSCGMQYWLDYVLEVSFLYLLRVLVYILMVREWSLIYNPCARVSFQVLK